uniref:Na+1/Ca+1 antiporter CaCA family n=1 Tax=uncultured marine group III euryarchaeote AD1000-40-D7 TaxID=526640 RepID=B3V636_9ARCH|nr:Na+1/Ca+1 antiporter CaCA family [uncultured marine group III euryarchaeote AD1000-40-D7]
MSLIIVFVILIIGFIFLTKGADYFIENSAAFAEDRGISPHVVGVTIVAFGTSLPELLVSVISSFQDHNDLALGNIVGSNISNIGLVLASASFIFYYTLGSPIEPENNANKDSYVMLFAALLLIFFAQDNLISFSEGFVFFILYVLYLVSLYFRSSKPTQIESETNTSYPFLVGGLIGMLLGAQITIASAVEIASQLGVSEIVIGLSVVAIGTSLPELAGTVSAARMGHKEIAIGNVIGSNIANIFMVMGILAMINAIKVEQWVLDITLPLLILITVATLGLIRVPFGRLSGSILFGFFILFIYELTI